MARDPDPVIEAEVIEIDGKAPLPPGPGTRPGSPSRRDSDDADETGAGHPWTSWQRWPGQVRSISPWWWPVLIVAGGILLGLLLTLGLIVGALFVIFRILRAVLRALFG